MVSNITLDQQTPPASEAKIGSKSAWMKCGTRNHYHDKLCNYQPSTTSVLLQAHGGRPFNSPTHTPLGPDSLSELGALLKEPATSASSPAPRATCLATEHPHFKPAPEAAATRAPGLPPPTLSFDFPDVPDDQDPYLRFPQHSSLQAPSPSAQKHAAFITTTPTTNLKILADQAMQKLLHPSPYIPRVPSGSMAASLRQPAVGTAQREPEAPSLSLTPSMLPLPEQLEPFCPAVSQALTALQPATSGIPAHAALASAPSCTQLESLQELWDTEATAGSDAQWVSHYHPAQAV